MDRLKHDIIYAFRNIRNSPGYAIVTILTLALGIGANTAIFSVVNGVILKPLGFPEPERLVFITSQFPTLGFDQFWVSPPEFIEFRERNQAFQEVGAYSAGAVNLGIQKRSRERVNSAVITSELMPVLGVQPIRGRMFTREDTLARRRGRCRTVIGSLAHVLSERRGGDRARRADRRHTDANRRGHAIRVRHPRSEGPGLAAADPGSGEPRRARQSLPLSRGAPEAGISMTQARADLENVLPAVGDAQSEDARSQSEEPPAAGSMACRTT